MRRNPTDRKFLLPFILAAACLCAGIALAPTATFAAKTPITRLSDLPTHTYTLPAKPSVMVEDPAAVLALSQQVEKDIRADLEQYDIQDATALRRMHGTLLTCALLRKDWPAAKELVAKVRDMQEKPAQKLTSGRLADAMIAAREAEAKGGDFQATLRSNLEASLRALPYAEVQDNLKQTKAQMEIMSRNLMIGSIASSVDPGAVSGKVSQDVAEGIISAGYALQNVIPNKDVIHDAYAAVVDANKTEKKADIWQAREITIDASQKATPVVVGIWDSGVDTQLFKDRLWVNAKEVPDNGKDDDKNGFVDDVHGIAWTLHGDPTPELLFPIAKEVGDPKLYQADLKGFTDLQSNVQSDEASALKKKLSGLPPDQVKPFIEGIGAYSNYAHGTHVAGIAARGNAAARLMAARLTFDYHAIPETPTVAQAKKDAAAMVRTVEYFQKNRVRVVNMSWGGDLRSIETALEQNNAGGTADERRALARQIYDIGYNALFEAIKKAPEILFVIAAGNADNDVKFDEVMPSSFKLPNVMIAGAVDQAGDETSFTSFGNVDVYSDGFEVESTIPGGEMMKLSGTSMAAPNVTNTAAKLWAVQPKLSVADVKRCIVSGADDKQAGARTIKLLNPKNALDLANGGAK